MPREKFAGKVWIRQYQAEKESRYLLVQSQLGKHQNKERNLLTIKGPE